MTTKDIQDVVNEYFDNNEIKVFKTNNYFSAYDVSEQDDDFDSTETASEVKLLFLITEKNYITPAYGLLNGYTNLEKYSIHHVIQSISSDFNLMTPKDLLFIELSDQEVEAIEYNLGEGVIYYDDIYDRVCISELDNYILEIDMNKKVIYSDLSAKRIEARSALFIAVLKAFDKKGYTFDNPEVTIDFWIDLEEN